MSHNDKYDLFIAYYGNAKDGSEMKARELYRQVHGVQIAPGRYLRAYFHPITNPYGSFEETPMIVARTPMFLLVVDQNIPTSDAGQLMRYREDGTLRNLYEEVRAFHDSPMYKDPGGENAPKLYITDAFDPKEAERLHPMFSGKEALFTPEKVVRWVQYFYPNVYCDRVFQKCRYMVKNRRDAFYDGKWLPEAEALWQSFRHEKIGRSLLIFYAYKAECGSFDAIEKLRTLSREFSGVQIHEEGTRAVLEKIKRQYLK